MKRFRNFHPWLIQNKIPVPKPEQEAKLEQFLELLLSWNRKMNLTADDNYHTLLTRHLLDSLTPLATEVIEKGPVIDVGSGTGFPSIPLAVMLPKTPFFLVEKVARKCAFLKMASRRLGLTNVKVVESLLQNWHQNDPMVQTATIRAVRVDIELKNQLVEKGVGRLLYFSSEHSADTILEYQLPSEERKRYLEAIFL
jgi:16S rRNA (guanine(527)-N(7))-methyltransferase RsmG